MWTQLRCGPECNRKAVLAPRYAICKATMTCTLLMQLKSNRFTSSCSLLHCVRVQRELYSVKRSSTRFTALEFAHILMWRGLLGTCRGRFAATQARCSAKNRLPYLRKTNNWARISAADGLRCLPMVTRRGSYGRDLLEIRPVKKKVGLIKFVENLAVVVIWPSLKQKRETDAKELCIRYSPCVSCSTTDPWCRNPL